MIRSASAKKLLSTIELKDIMAMDVRHDEGRIGRYKSLIWQAAPVAYWPMDVTSGLPTDQSGNGRDMTAVSGSPTYSELGPMLGPVIGYPSAAYHERAVVSTAVANFWVEMWVYRTGNASGDIWRHGVTSGGFEIEYTSSAGAFRPNVPGVGTLGGIGTIAVDTWTMIGVGRETTNWATFFQGAFNASAGTATPATPTGNDRVVGAGATTHRFAHVAFYDSAPPDQTTILRRYMTGLGY